MSRHIGYFKDALPGRRQQAVAEHYLEKDYKSNPSTLVVGALEELGEVAREVLLDDPCYVSRPDKERGALEHEIIDVLVYLCALASAYNIDLGI